MTTSNNERRPRLIAVANDTPFFILHRLSIALAARDAGWDVHVATPPHERVSEITATGLEWHGYPLSRSGLNPLKEIRSVRALLSLYRTLRPDLVHHVTSKPVMYGSLAARLSAVPAVVNTFAGLGYVFVGTDTRVRALRKLIGTGYRLLLGRERLRVIFENAEDRDLFVTSGFVRQNQTHVIWGGGIDVDKFVPHGVTENHAPVVLLASRLLIPKGVEIFVEAARQLKRRGSNARFVLVGEADPGNPATVPQAQLHAWHDEGAIEYWGPRTDMVPVFQESDIVCLPSFYREGVPRFLMEAAACGLPIVTTNMPGCRDIVEHGRSGFLVEPKDAVAVADALETLIRAPQLRSELGRRGREIAVERFALTKVVDETLAVYQELR